MIVALFTDAENRERRREIVDLQAGESRGDIQFVLSLDGTMSDFPEEYEYLSEDDTLKVIHPIKEGETCESYGVIRLRWLR